MSVFALSVVVLGVASAAEPSPSQLVLYKQLSARHMEQSCGELVESDEGAVADLVWLAENSEQPAWVAIRAADCVLELEPTSPAATRWVTTPALKGLAITTVQKLDRMPLAVSESVARAALSGPLSEALAPRIARLERPELRALVVKAP